MCGCLSCTPYWGPGLESRHVPWLGIKWATLWFAGQRSIPWATPARAVLPFLTDPRRVVNFSAHSAFYLLLESNANFQLLKCRTGNWKSWLEPLINIHSVHAPNSNGTRGKQKDPPWIFLLHTLFTPQSMWLDLEVANVLQGIEAADLIAPTYFLECTKERSKGMSPDYASNPWGARLLLFILLCQWYKDTWLVSLPTWYVLILAFAGKAFCSQSIFTVVVKFLFITSYRNQYKQCTSLR